MTSYKMQPVNYGSYDKSRRKHSYLVVWHRMHEGGTSRRYFDKKTCSIKFCEISHISSLRLLSRSVLSIKRCNVALGDVESSVISDGDVKDYDTSLYIRLPISLKKFESSISFIMIDILLLWKPFSHNIDAKTEPDVRSNRQCDTKFWHHVTLLSPNAEQNRYSVVAEAAWTNDIVLLHKRVRTCIVRYRP